MDSISVIKPDMAVLGLNTLGLSPFGVLSQLFTMELSSRAGLDVTPMLPLDLALLSEDGGDEEQTQQSRRLDLSLELIIRRLNETLVRSENAAGAKTGSESGAAAKEMSAKTKQELEHIILRELRIREGRRLTETRRDIRTVELVAPTQSTAQPSVQSLPQTYSALAIQRRGTSLRGYGQNKTEKDAASVFGTDSRPAGNAADVRAAYAAEHGAMALKADGIRAGRLKDPTQSSVPATGGWDVTWREEHPGFAGKPPLRETEVKPERSILLPDVLRERRAEALRRHEASTEERGAELEYIQNAAETAADKDIGGYNRASGTAGSVPVIAEAGPGAQAVPETERRSAGMLPETVPARAAASPGKAEKSTPRAASYAETADTVNPAEQSGGYERREYERRKDERALLFTDGGAVPERKAPADDGTGEGAAPRAVPVSADAPMNGQVAETTYLEAETPPYRNEEAGSETAARNQQTRTEAQKKSAQTVGEDAQTDNAAETKRPAEEGRTPAAAADMAAEKRERIAEGTAQARLMRSEASAAETAAEETPARAIPVRDGLSADETAAETAYLEGTAAIPRAGVKVETDAASAPRTYGRAEETKRGGSSETQDNMPPSTAADLGGNGEPEGLGRAVPTAIPIRGGEQPDEPPTETAYLDGTTAAPRRADGNDVLAPRGGSPAKKTQSYHAGTALDGGAKAHGEPYGVHAAAAASIGGEPTEVGPAAGIEPAEREPTAQSGSRDIDDGAYAGEMNADGRRRSSAANAGEAPGAAADLGEDAFDTVPTALPVNGVSSASEPPAETAYLEVPAEARLRAGENAPSAPMRANTVERAESYPQRGDENKKTAPSAPEATAANAASRKRQEPAAAARALPVRTAFDAGSPAETAYLEGAEPVQTPRAAPYSANASARISADIPTARRSMSETARSAGRSIMTAPPVLGRTLTKRAMTPAPPNAEVPAENGGEAALAMPAAPGSGEYGSEAELTYALAQSETSEQETEQAPEWVQRLLERTGGDQAGRIKERIAWSADSQTTWSAPYSLPKTGATSATGLTAPPKLTNVVEPFATGETVFRQKQVQTGDAGPGSSRMSDAELRRTADRVYGMIEERLRKELRRSGR